jgi:hypothetical protein
MMDKVQKPSNSEITKDLISWELGFTCWQRYGLFFSPHIKSALGPPSSLPMDTVNPLPRDKAA